MKQNSVDVFAVLDMDRTLLDTAAVTERLCRQLERHGVPRARVDKDIDFIQGQTGQSFLLLDFLETQYGPELFSIIKQEVQESVERGRADDGLLCEGANELLNALEEAGVPFAILTYGEQANQDFKLTLLRNLLGRSTAQLHAVVTQVSNKASWIADTWAQEEGFAVPDTIHAAAKLWARQVVIIDDKSINLASDNPNILGILVNNTGKSTHTTAEVARRLRTGLTLPDIAIDWKSGLEEG